MRVILFTGKGGVGKTSVAATFGGRETELSQTLETQWGSIQKYLSALLAWRGMEETGETKGRRRSKIKVQ